MSGSLCSPPSRAGPVRLHTLILGASMPGVTLTQALDIERMLGEFGEKESANVAWARSGHQLRLQHL